MVEILMRKLITETSISCKNPQWGSESFQEHFLKHNDAHRISMQDKEKSGLVSKIRRRAKDKEMFF